MDSWGVVIVAVVSVAGTVWGAVLANRHTERLAAAQRRSEAMAYRRDKLVGAFSYFMVEIDQLTYYKNSGNGVDEDELDKMLARLDAKELTLSAFGTAGVARAAREVSFQIRQGPPMANQRLRPAEDALVEAMRDALLEA